MLRKELNCIMKDAERVHFVGIGGISMSSLAAITREQGYEVSGSDRVMSKLTERLQKSGITVHEGHEAQWVQGASLVVYTAAVHGDNPELAEAELAQAAVIEEYLPKQLSPEELEAQLRGIIAELGVDSPAGMGKVMGTATKRLAGLADGRAISELVKKILNS